jgi:hypothetical protein
MSNYVYPEVIPRGTHRQTDINKQIFTQFLWISSHSLRELVLQSKHKAELVKIQLFCNIASLCNIIARIS